MTKSEVCANKGRAAGGVAGLVCACAINKGAAIASELTVVQGMLLEPYKFTRFRPNTGESNASGE